MLIWCGCADFLKTLQCQLCNAGDWPAANRTFSWTEQGWVLSYHQVDQSSIPRLGVACGSSLLVLYYDSVTRRFSPSTPVLPSLQKPSGWFDISWFLYSAPSRPNRRTQCCTQFKSPGVKILSEYCSCIIIRDSVPCFSPHITYGA